ncbi:response regulator [Shouchella miscanthi]|uniref:Response regulator n=1 Tax=Shouchella miscanthi TaxID=2598861 RepID=A0ABU6NHP7_9BACI|nr:response regulator [Shouchella miscanthi]MED4127723.1 response regulator [Shouchella miscanthi]
MIDVMIVEDDPMVAEVTANYMNDLSDFRLVAQAKNVEEAKAHVMKLPSVHLVLLDVYMPGEPGLTLLPFLREQKMSVDVIVLTAASDTDSVQTALRYGAIDYLIKPFQFTRFQEALLRFKKKQDVWLDKKEMNQKQLDELWSFNEKEDRDKAPLPKGLTRETLTEVWRAIEKVGQESFSTEDVALHARISRVSVKKYLTFLLEYDILELQPTYGSIGRPIHLYKMNYEKKQRIKALL